MIANGSARFGGEPVQPNGSVAHRRARQIGFTLVELMVTLAVLVILLTIAAPSFQNVTLGSRLSSYANSLVASAHLARSEAIKRNAVVTLCVSSDGTSCGAGDWAQGWIVTAGGTVFQRQEALATGFKIIGSAGIVDFQPTGVGATNTPATFKVCRATPSVGSQERVVTIEPSGRPRVETPTPPSGSCS